MFFKMQLTIFIFIFCVYDGYSKSLPLEDTNEISDGSQDPENKDEFVVDLSYLGESIYGEPSLKSGELVDKWDENSGVNPEELGEYAEGDILVPDSNGRNALIAESSKWKDGVVPYVIEGVFTPEDLNKIYAAFREYSEKTCIRFRPRLMSDPDYIAITNEKSGCWATVGRIGGRQQTNLQSGGCTALLGTPIHEFMHVLGVGHEHTRFDRDDYVKIIWNNIKPKKEINFQKGSKQSTSGYGVNYDFDSVMHYTKNAFSANGSPTIVPIGSQPNNMGQRVGFSNGDLRKINNMYNCKNNKVSSPSSPSSSNVAGQILSFFFG